MNRRVEIREAIRAILMGLTAADERVFASRVDSVQASEMPCVMIFDDQETAGPSSNQGALIRTVPITIQGRMEFTEEDGDGYIDELLDAFAADIEAAIAEAQMPSFVRSISYRSSDKEIKSESETDIGSVQLSYEVTYMTSR